MGTILWPHAMVVPIQCLSPRNAVRKAKLFPQLRKLANGNRDPTPEYGRDEAIAELHFQIAAVKRLTEIPSQGAAVPPVDRVTKPKIGRLSLATRKSGSAADASASRTRVILSLSP